ncbi:MAG: nucleotidyltransferase family protein [Gammaproteobacteria bacterium]|nr:nucleotidyltransferase family protein [Gammaproteobacteria bacterium]MCY4228523.1 nucleotidyltransferase family protein [Gammaproteobacteria bacterium]
MNMEKVFGELLAGLREAMEVGDRQSNQEILARVDDWSSFVHLAERHRVLALIRLGLRHACILDPEVEEIMAPLRQAWNARGLMQITGLNLAVECLDQHGIPVLVLKGMPLSEHLYGAPLARENSDIDILIPPVAMNSAVDALCMNGWKPRSPPWQPKSVLNRYFDRYVNNRTFSGPGGVLELHHRLTNNPYLLHSSFEELDSRAMQVEINGAPFRTMGNSDLLIYLCVHGQLHRWSRLKWLCDIAALMDIMTEDGYMKALKHAQSQGLSPRAVFGTALKLCNETFSMDLPESGASLVAGPWILQQRRKTWSLWLRPGGGKGLQGVARLLDQMQTRLAATSLRGLVHELLRLCLRAAAFWYRP